jgi:hypothetical protein
MVAAISVESARDTFLAELTEAVLKVANRHGSRGSSVDLEIDLWNRLGAVLRQPAPAQQPDGDRWETRLARLTDAAYAVVLSHGFMGSFIELEMDLWRALRQMIRTRRFLPGSRRVNLAGGGVVGAGTHLSSVLDIR